ncbi:hypothetical protein JOC83_002097 [Bacillus iocasae]|uniref:Uncharacterized protein n=2 Tax=Priestia iocasae TaxID=2291674 RepID=A0ABS2QV23_9BACI|nr:DUF6123 family protein [Metabacillus iocasae]MBM7703250.1 hypothetical protein [Metabacillus iocasae]
MRTVQTVEEYLLYLKDKGFYLREDAQGFIMFGQHYTEASDDMVMFAIEWTLKVQKEFDGSFFLSLLESIILNKIKTKKQAFLFLKEKGMIT